MPRPAPPVSERKSAAPRRGGRVLLTMLMVSGLLTAIMLAASLQGHPRFSVLPPPSPAQEGVGVAEPTPSGTPAPLEELEDSVLITIVGTVIAVIVVAAVLAALFLAGRMLVRLLIELWRNRALARRAATVVDSAPATGADAGEEPDSAAIRRGIAEALRTIESHPTPQDSIIAAWVAMEETASDAGVGRRSSETPAEFTTRIIGSRSGVSGDIATLLDLYERVRFGGHRAGEQDRAVASRCLRAIEKGWR